MGLFKNAIYLQHIQILFWKKKKSKTAHKIQFSTNS